MSRWREFSFALHQVQFAIEPNLSLKHTLLNWNGIARALAENPRARLEQGLAFDPRSLAVSVTNTVEGQKVQHTRFRSASGKYRRK
jgi:hypothetical protein